MPDALDRFDADLVAAARDDADVTGDVTQIERCICSDLAGLGDALGLFGSLPRFLEALEPSQTRTLVGAASESGQCRRRRHAPQQRGDDQTKRAISNHGY